MSVRGTRQTERSMEGSRGARLAERLWRPWRDPEHAGDGASLLEDLVVITGFSGAGKSTAMAVFEDVGYFCVDNLPPEMIRSIADLFSHQGAKVERAAIVSDVRTGTYFEGLVAILDDLEAREIPYRLVFLEADEATLLTRHTEH